jgi:cell wall-associated NlpC family hydrolase
VSRPDVDTHFHITGVHGFRAVLPPGGIGSAVALRFWPAGSPTITELPVSTPGARIVAVARRYVNISPYRTGGASPAGFDCSGFTMYSYAQGQVASLPHNSQSQRYAPYMRPITKSQARPGDLVFYLSGSYAYHVAVYAGNGMQYAATEPGQKIRYQAVWSSRVEYRTDWH